jgi:hypothetical protein
MKGACRASPPYDQAMKEPPRRDRPVRPALWECPRCGRTFANANQTHTCAALGDLDRHFAGSAPEVRRTFDRVLAVAESLGPVSVLPERSRIAFHVRMSFAAFMPRRAWLDGHLVLARRIESPRFRRIEEFSPRNVLHAFRLTSAVEVNAEFAAWLAEAYAVGEQRHLVRRAD